MHRLLIALVAAAACGKGDKPPPPSTGGPSMPETGPKNSLDSIAMETATELFNTKCAMCHGIDGTGHGPMADQLNGPKPRNYTDAKWQQSVTDDELKKVITLGGQATGKSAMMPANLDLRDQPQVLNALVKIIRRFGTK